MQVFFILFSVHFAVYQYINSKCLYRTHVNLFGFTKQPDQKKYRTKKSTSSFLNNYVVRYNNNYKPLVQVLVMPITRFFGFFSKRTK